MKRSIAAAVCLVVFAVPAALAHEQTSLDRDDSPGPLDLVAVRHKHQVLRQVSSHPERSRRVTELRYRIVTYDRWARSAISGRKNFISIEFNLDDDRRVERCLVITYEGGPELRGSLYRRCGSYPQRELITTLSVSRPDRHSVHTMVEKHRLRRDIAALQWRVVTSFEDPEAGENGTCWPGTFPTPGPYGVCTDVTKWRPHRF